MYKSFLSFLFVGVLAASVTGCSKDDAQDAIDGTKNVADDPELLGTYSGECAGAGFIQAGVQDTYKFEGNSFTRIQTFYSDNTCASDSKLGEIKYDGEFKVDSDSDVVTNGGAVDITLQSANLNISNQTLADLLNTIQFCGRNDYGIGAEFPLEGSATDDIGCPVETVPSTRYGAYTVDDGKLFLNRDAIKGMSVKEDERPTEVLKEQALTK